MECIAHGSEIFVRLDPGERLVESLTAVATNSAFSAAAIVSGVGMLSGVELGFFDVALNDYKCTVFDGVYDLSVVMGNMYAGTAFMFHMSTRFSMTLRIQRTVGTSSMQPATSLWTIFLATTASALKQSRFPVAPLLVL